MNVGTTTHAAGRHAGYLFIVAGIVTVLNVVLPGSTFADPVVVAELGSMSVVVGLVALIVPWDRLPHRATLAVVPLAFALITVGNRWGHGSDFIYAPYFIVTFIWIGLFHAPKTALWLAPMAAGAYVAPLLTRPGDTNLDVASVMVVIPVAIAVSEVVSRTVAKQAGTMEKLQGAMVELDRARSESQHRADLLAEVARASRLLNSLRSGAVFEATVDSVHKLGFDCGYLRVLDEGEPPLVRYNWGLPPGFDRGAPMMDEGLVGRCRRERRAVVLRAGTESDPTGELQMIGARSAVAGPVLVSGTVSAVLVGGRRTGEEFSPEQIESFELIAGQAGRALENAERYETERRTRHMMAEASVRDELTGVGNRRHATAMLESLQEGDALLLVDLDRFKQVNDTDGHLTGDRVLADFGQFLRDQLRYEDSAARYGGEEFLIALRGVGVGAPAAAERLLASWRETQPRVTLSIGVAVHRSDVASSVTLGNADRALYSAKRTGRDRVCEWGVD